MKNLITFLAIFLTISTTARPIKGTIDDVFCGEVDPFAVGDACLVLTTDTETGNKLGLVYRDFDWSYNFIPANEDATTAIGKEFTADLCSTIPNIDIIRELKEFNSEYFYLECNVFGFSF